MTDNDDTNEDNKRDYDVLCMISMNDVVKMIMEAIENKENVQFIFNDLVDEDAAVQRSVVDLRFNTSDQLMN